MQGVKKACFSSSDAMEQSEILKGQRVVGSLLPFEDNHCVLEPSQTQSTQELASYYPLYNSVIIEKQRPSRASFDRGVRFRVILVDQLIRISSRANHALSD